MAGAPSLLPMQAADEQRAKQAEEDTEDILYQSAVPGVENSITKDADKLNVWARRLQMQWLGEGDAGRNDLEHLNARVKHRVRLQHQRDVKKRSNQIRRELFFWVIWAVLLALVLDSFGLRESFKYSAKVRQEILGESEELLEGVSTREGVWDFIEQTLNPTIFPEDTSDPDYILRKNTMIGALRLQQTRTIKNSGCKIPKVYAKIIPACYPSLDDTPPSQESFGVNRQFVAEEMMEFPISKHVYIFDIASDLNISSANKELNDLKAQDWLDLESAQLRVRNTHAGRYYNPGVDMFCSVQITFDFQAHGGVESNAIFRVLDPQRHLLSVVPDTKKYFPPDAYRDTVLLTAELIFIVLIFLSLLAELRWLTKHGPIRWLKSVWHPTDLMNCVVLSTVYFLRLALLNIADEFEFAPKPFEYSDFFEMAYYVHLIQNMLGISALLTYSKLIKYLQINTRVSALTRTFMQVRTQLFGQIIAFAIIVVGYVFGLHHAFGRHVKSYSTLGRTVDNLFYVILGEFDITELRQARTRAP